MVRKTSPGGKALSLVMSVVLVLGLMPLPAYAATGAENAGGRSELTPQTSLVAGTLAGQDPETSNDPADEQADEGALMSAQGEDGLAMTTQAADTVKEIGTGDETSTANPWYAYYYNTYSVQLYTGQEIGVSGDITSIAFKLYAKSTDLESEFLKIYLAQTEDVNLASGTSATFSPVESDYTLVYDGTPTIKSKTSGWQTFEFNQNGNAYTYDKSKNLIVVVVTQTVTETSGTPTVVASTTSEYTALSNKTSAKGTYTTLMTKPVSLTASKKRPDIQLSLETCAHENKTFTQTVAPTCTEQGYNLYHCNDCNKDVKLDYTDALGHAWSETGVACNADGTENESGSYLKYTCTRDGCDAVKIDFATPGMWDGEASISWVDGSGTSEDPYIIDSVAHLRYLATQVNAGTSYSGIYFKQTRDFDLGNYAWTSIGTSTSSRYFRGNYDGDHHKIKGLSVSGTGNVGLFGYISGAADAYASVKGVSLDGAVTGSGSNVAGLIGYGTYVDVFECENKATITSTYSSTNANVGGIIGMFSNGTINACANKGNISSSSNYVGGIVGNIATGTSPAISVVSNCYNTGNVSASYYAAGIVGYQSGYTTAKTVENCYNVGTISQTNTGTYADRSAGIVGFRYGGSTPSNSTYTNCYSASGVAPKDIVGFDNNSSGYVQTNCSAMSADDMKAASFATTLGDAYIAGNPYPMLSWEAPAGIPVISDSALADAAYVKGTTTVTGLSVTATSDTETYGPVSYQWYKATKADLSDAEAISEATTATYTPASDTIGDYYYYCAVHNNVKKLDNSGPYLVQSGMAHIKVWSGKEAVAPTITTQPQSIAKVEQLATEGNTLTVAASFAGDDETEDNCVLTYQWQVSDAEDGTFVNVASGGTEATFAAPTTALGTKYYRCVVTNTREEQADYAKSATSDAASVTVVGLTITTEKQLADFRDSVNAGNSFEGATVTLGADLDLSQNSEGYTAGDWTPIGNASNPYKGSFDGGGHTISGVNITDSILKYTGLFGYVRGTSGSPVSISNLVVSGSRAVKDTVGTSNSYAGHGGIAGYAEYVTFTGCGNKASVDKTAGSTNSYTYAYAALGGIAGVVGPGCSFEACYNKGALSASISSSYQSANTVRIGGIAGSLSSATTFTSCYNAGPITHAAASSSYIGGIATASSGYGWNAQFKNCYNSGTITSSVSNNTGGITGYIYSSGVIGTSDDPSYMLQGSVTRGDYATSGTTNPAYFQVIESSTFAGASFVDTLNSTHAGTWLAASLGSDETQTSPILYWEQNADVPVLDSTKPADVSIAKDETATLEVADTRTGVTTGALSYQWKVSADGTVGDSDANASGASTAATYSPSASAAGVYYYYCVVTNTVSEKAYPATSRVAKVTVTSDDPAKTPVVSISGPSEVGQLSTGNALAASVSYDEGDAGVVGELTYQWYKLGSESETLSDDEETGNAISGATSATYTVTDTATIGTAYYACVVKNTFGDKVQTGKAVHAVEVTALHIKDESGLKAFRDAVNAGNSYEGADVYLDADITLTADWEPIGKATSTTPTSASDRPFKGKFHGQGYTISNMNVTATTATDRTAGLFGVVYGGEINNLVVKGTVSGGTYYIAGVAGLVYNGGKFTNVGSDVTVTLSGSNTSCRVGGIAGYVTRASSTDATVEFTGCYNKGNVTAPGNAGGIVGYSYYGRDTYITSCYNTGKISTTSDYAGGLIGSTYGTDDTYKPVVKNSYNVGAVEMKATGSYYRGGSLYGNTVDYTGSASDKNYYENGSLTLGSSSGLSFAIGGRADGSYATGMDATDMAAASFIATLNNASADGDYNHAGTWASGAPIGQAGPALSWEVPAGTPTITTQPVDGLFELVDGSKGTVLSVTAALPDTGQAGSDGTLSFVWYRVKSGSETEDVLVSTAENAATSNEGKTSTFTPPHSTAGQATYYCVVTNTWDTDSTASLSSSQVIYTVLSAEPQTPTISVVSATPNEDVAEGTEITLSVTSSVTDDGTQSYQWYSNKENSTTGGTAISGATTAEYKLAASGVGDTYYYCTVKNTVSGIESAAATSDAVKVTVTPAMTISTPEGMLEFQQKVNGTGEYASSQDSFEGKTVVLAADVDLSTNDDTKNWTSIGTNSKPFKGTFDGQGHTISGLSLNASSQYQGLFGYANGATIKQLVLEGSVVNGAKFTGGVLGYGTGVTLQDIGNRATVASSGASTGGVVGEIAGSSKVIGCYNWESVSISSTSSEDVGGVVGYASSATAEIVSCYNAGTVSAAGSGKDRGGVVGRVTNATSSGPGTLIVNCYNYGAVLSSGNYAGAIAGYGTPSTTSTGNYYLNTTSSYALGSATANTTCATAMNADSIKTVDFVTTLNTDHPGTWKAGAASLHADHPALSWEKEYTISTITFNLGGGSWAQDYTAPTEYAEGMGVDLPAAADVVAPDGYKFVGWYENAEYDGTAITVIGSEATGSKSFYAKYDAKTDLSTAAVTIAAQDYTGSALAPVVKVGEDALTAGDDYTITYKDSDGNGVEAANLVNAGTYTATIVGAGDDYTGTATAAFTINRAKIAPVDEPAAEGDELTATDSMQLLVKAGTGYGLGWSSEMAQGLISDVGTALVVTNEDLTTYSVSEKGAYGKAVGTYVIEATPDANHQWTSAPMSGSSISALVAQAVMSAQDDEPNVAPKTITVTIKEASAESENTFKADAAEPVITTQADMDAFAAAVNGGNSFQGKAVSISEQAVDGLQVTSRIGSASAPFSGTFDGNGYKLNVLITGTDRQGLFGALIGTESNPATVKNLIITGAVTTTAVDDSQNGRVGAVTPTAAGVVVIQNVGNEAEIEAMGEGAYYAGGLVGYVTSHPTDYYTDGDLTITGCYSRGSITAAGQYAGGLVGYSDDWAKTSVTNSYVNATVKAGTYAGGFFGGYEGANWSSDLHGAVNSSYRTGTVTGSKAGAMVGGMVGSITFTDVYNDSADEAKHTGDGEDKTGVTNKTAAELKGLAATLGASFKADATDAEKMINAGFPVLTWEDITATQPTAHNITVATGIEGGTVVAKPSYAAAGSSVAVMVTPDSTHTVGTVTYKPAGGDATEIEAVGGTYTFTMPDADVEVSATFAEKTAHVVTVDAGENGTASASPTSAVEGQTVTVTAVPASGYQVDEMTATDGESSAASIEVDGNEGTFTMPDSAVTVSVTFKEYKPLSVSLAKYTGQSTNYSPLAGATSSAWYQPTALINNEQPASDDYIKGGQLVIQWYEKGAAEVEKTAEAEFNQWGSNKVKYGSFAFSKDTAGTYAYCAKAVWKATIDGVEYTAESDEVEWVFTVRPSTSLSIATTPDEDVTVTVVDKDGKPVYPGSDGKYLLDNEQKYTITATPTGAAAGSYEAKAVEWDSSLGDSLSIKLDAQAPATFTVSKAESEHGSFEVSPLAAAEGATVAITPTPDQGYEVDAVSYRAEGEDPVAVESADGKYTFEMPAKAVIVSVTFKAIPVDKSALEKAVADAEAAIDGVQGSTAALAATLPDGAKWADADELAAYKLAIAAAKAVLESDAALQAKVDEAAAALAKPPAVSVVAVDRSALATAIAEAASDLSGTTVAESAAVVDEGVAFATQDQAAALGVAIAEAEGALDDPAASQARVDAAADELAAARAAFDAAKGIGTKAAPGPVDKSALEASIAAARKALDEGSSNVKPVGTAASDVAKGEEYVTRDAVDALEAAIADAEAVAADDTATAEAVAAAKAAVEKAAGDFAAAKKTGSKENTPDEPATPAAKAEGVVRLQGERALDTMAAIVARGSYGTGGAVVLTTIDGYWDALTAAGAAGLAGAPVLMTDGGELSPQTRAIIRELAPAAVMVCGGAAAVSDAAAAQALAAAPGARLERFWGDNAVLTACDIYAKAPAAAGGEWASAAIVATNDGYWDALAAAPLSYALHMPIFLTDGASSISEAALAAMAAGGVEEAYIAGGELAVSPAVEAQLAAAGIRVAGRLAGETAVETSEAVAQFGLDRGMTCDSMGVATNDGYWDALAGAALCGRLNSVLVLAGSAADASVAPGGFVDEHAPEMSGLYVFGGPAAVDPSIEDALKAQVG